MAKVKTNLEIPQDAYLALSSSGYTKQRISFEARSLLAAYLFKRGVLSLGKAAELAELNLGAFITYLDDLEIPVVDYDKDELNAEFKVAKKLKKDQ